MPEFHCRYRSQKSNFVGELMKKKNNYLKKRVEQIVAYNLVVEVHGEANG